MLPKTKYLEAVIKIYVRGKFQSFVVRMAEVKDFPLFIHKAPALISITGVTGAGKTSILATMLHYATMGLFDQQVAGIVLCYSIFQNIYNKLQAESTIPFKLHLGLPSQEEINKYKKEFGDRHWVLACDDLASDIVESKDMLHNFEVASHHLNFSQIVLQHNFFSRGRYARQMNLQFHYSYLTPTRRDMQQITNIGQKFFPGKASAFRQVFQDATSISQPQINGVKLPGFLLIDNHPHIPDPDLELTTSRFPPGESFIMYRI
jgi:hypothetical protein